MISKNPKKGFQQRKIEILLAQRGWCFYCAKHMDSISHPQSKRGYTIDHFYPKSEGNDKNSNKVYAHVWCNNKKKSRHPTPRELRKYNKLIDTINNRRREITKYDKTLREVNDG